MERKALSAVGANRSRLGQPVIGIETSCDETACAILDDAGKVLAEAVASQITEHAKFGGVVPEIAARAHLTTLPTMVQTVLKQAGLKASGLRAVAATTGPGLIGGLIVGANFAKAMALATGADFYAINHLEAHALTARLPGIAKTTPAFPYLLLLASGGHTMLLDVRGVGEYRVVGTTRDDAAGEAFDKVAKILGLPYPGGPALEQLAMAGDAAAIQLPRPMLGRGGCDFSFSGLKTAVAQLVGRMESGALDIRFAADVAASFQAAVLDILADRLRQAVALTPDATAVVASGGVAANQAIRSTLTTVAVRSGLPLIAPPMRLCTDNAVMVAWAAIERMRAGLRPDTLDAKCLPRWGLV